METTKKQAIVFAFYNSNNELLGFRLDTMGTIGFKYPKIYHYSKEQVETVLDNVRYNIKSDKSYVADLVAKHNPLGGALIEGGIKAVHNKVNSFGSFEIRVLTCPDYTGSWVYPKEAIEEWIKGLPDSAKILETHKFGVEEGLSV